MTTRSSKKSPDSQNSRVKEGEWEVLPYDSQIEAVHMALLHTGKVLYYSGYRLREAIKTDTRLWNPKTGDIKDPTTPKEDIFCAGHSFLPDGRLLSTGGTLEYRTKLKLPAWLQRLARPILQLVATIAQRYFGLKNPYLLTGDSILYLFNPKTEKWESPSRMLEGRWYPTNTTLPDGQILILSGRNEAGGVDSKEEAKINMRIEVYDADKGSKQVGIIPKEKMDHGDHKKQHHGFPSLYPRIHVLPLSKGDYEKYPAGKAFCSGYGPKTKMLNLHTWEWEDVDSLIDGIRHDGCSVLLPLRPPDYRAKILTCGGSKEETGEPADAKNTAEMIDFGEEFPKWKMIDSMPGKRVHAGSVILPDGNVLLVGGNSTGLFSDPVYNVELFDSVKEEWKMLTPISVPRGYHATTVLLPDGRVLVSGTTPWRNEELRMEVYSPYYLFKGERLVITEVAQSISYGQSFQVGYSCETSSIKTAVLIRPGSMTHAFDMDQRYVQLEISDNADNRLTVKAPPDAHIAPPGYYMLFLLSDKGVPSEAEFVHLPVQPQP